MSGADTEFSHLTNLDHVLQSLNTGVCVYTYVQNVCPGTKCMKGGSVKLNLTG